MAYRMVSGCAIAVGHDHRRGEIPGSQTTAIPTAVSRLLALASPSNEVLATQDAKRTAQSSYWR